MGSRDKALDRIRKLLELSRSDNPNEAANAAAAAARIMALHGIDSVDQIDAEEDPVGDNRDLYVKLGRGKALPQWKWSLAWAVAEAGNCKPYPLHEITDYKISATLISFIGRRSDAQICCYLYAHLLHELKRLRREKLPSVGKRLQRFIPGAEPIYVDRAYQRRWSRDFYLGAYWTIHQRMNEARTDVMETASSKALVFLGNVSAQVDQVAEGMGVEYVKPPTFDVLEADGYRAGIEAGRRVDLSTPGSSSIPAIAPTKE